MSYVIQMDPETQQSCPVIVCDGCGGNITDTSDGNALWLESGSRDRVRHFQMLHTHKKCNYAFERLHPAKKGELWMSHELVDDLRMLLENTGYHASAARRRRMQPRW